MRAVSVVLIAAALTGATVERGSATALKGTVGPGFTITLKTPSCSAVRKLRPGSYRIVVSDLSPIHNFHLFGPGVNKKTSVEETGTTTWTLRLTGGTYRYRCDPHRTLMHGSFVVG